MKRCEWNERMRAHRPVLEQLGCDGGLLAPPAPVAEAAAALKGSGLASGSRTRRSDLQPGWHRSRDEFEDLIAEHLPRLRAKAVQLCQTHADAEDLLQDAMLRACRARQQLKDRECVRSWLLSIVTNTFIDEFRKQRSRPPLISLDLSLDIDLEPQANHDAIEPLPWESISLEDLRVAIERLPDDVRDTYRLFALERRSYLEIATALSIPKATVGTRLSRARKKLCAMLAVPVQGAA